MMKYHTTPAPVFSQAELDQRIINASGFYNKYVMLDAFTFAEAIALYEDYKKSGHTIDDTYPPVAMPTGAGGFSQLYQIRMVKPAKQQKSELAMIATEETEKYNTFLKQQTAIAVERMTERLIGEEAERVAKERLIEDAAKLEAAKVQAAEILGVSLS